MPYNTMMDKRVAAQLTFYEWREKLSKRQLRALRHQVHYLRLSLQPLASHEANAPLRFFYCPTPLLARHVAPLAGNCSDSLTLPVARAQFLPSLVAAEHAEEKQTVEGMRLELELTRRMAAQLKLKLNDLQEDHEHLLVRHEALTAQHAWEARAATAAQALLADAIASIHEQEGALAAGSKSIATLQVSCLDDTASEHQVDSRINGPCWGTPQGRLLTEGTERSTLEAALQRERAAAVEAAREHAALEVAHAQALGNASAEAQLEVCIFPMSNLA